MNNNKKEYTFLWFIENYSYCWHKNGEKLVSPVFTAKELQRTAWTLWLFPRGKYEKDNGTISIYLNRNEDDGPDVFTVNYHLSIVAEDGSTAFSRKYASNFLKKEHWGWLCLEMDEMLSRRKAEYLPKDILTVCCKLSNGKENADKVAPIYGRTRIGIEHISFHHTVEGFSALEPNQKKTYLTHSPSQMGRVRSCMYVSDGSCCEEKLMVEITPSGSGQILAKCELYLLEASGKKTKCSEADNRFDAKRKEIGKLPLSLTKDEIMNKKSEYLPDDKLSLLCDCTFSTGIEFQRIEGIQNEITTTVGKLASDNPHIKYANISTEKLAVCPSVADDLKDIYNSKFLTDVELKTKTNSFPAHKNVLCARSPVFKVMMSNDMKEKNSDFIQVDDLEDGTAQQLLLFLYSDNLEDLQWETATKLYYAADKYQIEKLRLICSSFLIDNLTTSTATELLLLADTHSDSDLRKFVEDFILDHDEQVFGSEKWERLMEVNPQLALKTMHLKYKTKEVGK
ncbi:TD and POZ domain-containing protein 5 [Araneus ventricosus]|uniref:TD and POZ domain-containing protein 5 n=1 Tax=Araneus ventricosus TaxID=182803 RepID=A0A4Y2QUJ5_ARAVE|nr:TD and POZ domain-containing protein 5 [Araneus ventricosus]